MPTLVTINKVAIRIYPTDHEIAHVHVIGADFEAKISIEKLVIISSTNVRPAQLKPYIRWLVENKPTVRAKWIEIHGPIKQPE